MSEEIEDQLANVDLPTNLDAFVELAIKVDNQLCACEWLHLVAWKPEHTHHWYASGEDPYVQLWIKYFT